MTDKWLKDLHDKMADFEVAEPDGLWAEIEARGKAARHGRFRRLAPVWLRPLSVAASFAVAVVIAIMLITGTGNVVDLSEGKRMAGKRPDSNEAAVIAAVQASAPDVVSRKAAPNAISSVGGRPEADGDEARPAGEGSVEAQLSENTVDNHGASDDMESHRPSAGQAAAGSGMIDPPAPRAVARKRRVSVGVFTSGGIGVSGGSSLRQDRLAAADYWYVPDRPDDGSSEIYALSARVGAGADVAGRMDMQHHQPVRFGLSVRYDITPRISIESGVAYSLLRSDFKSADYNHTATGEQELHYVGIPLDIQYRLASWRSFDFYASAGLLCEKCVSGKISWHGTPDGVKSGGIREKQLQWSANASAGVQFSLTHNIGLYAEPGVSYFFDNASPVRTIYKDRPLNFNLNLGLRFSLGD